MTKEDYSLKLYTNDVTPGESDTVGTYTEAAGGGYAAKTISTGSWAVASSEATYPMQTWDFYVIGGPAAVYGYYLVGASSGTLILAERFAVGPYDMSARGASLRLTLQLTAE